MSSSQLSIESGDDEKEVGEEGRDDYAIKVPLFTEEEINDLMVEEEEKTPQEKKQLPKPPLCMGKRSFSNMTEVKAKTPSSHCKRNFGTPKP
jgi:hypothetical protein